MDNAIPRTLRGFAEILVRLGIATEEQTAAGLAEAADIGLDLDEEFEDAEDADELTCLLDFCSGLGFQTPEKMGVDLEEMVHEIAACTGGSVVVDEVERVEVEEGLEYLHYRRNGRSVWHRTRDPSDNYRYLDWNIAFDIIGDLAPCNDDPRIFYQLEEDSYDAWWLPLTPEQAAGLQEFGLPLPVDLGDRVRDGIPTAEPETLAWYMEDDRLQASEESRRRLDEWLAPMDGALERWRTAHLPGDFPFDHSPDSLAALERLVLDRFDGPAALEAAAGEAFFEGAVRYVGETALRLRPCRWTYRHSDDEERVFTSELLITANTPHGFGAAFSPDHVLRSLVQARTSGGMRDRMGALGEAVEEYHKALRARARTR
ncbi:hypothetical protein [Streptomyces sp. NPDC048638]|uniref:hypothetical protein n=1 Tax=Streptomyces sp. NPDC048638 TaxID=3365580 RepID=UPI0037167444